MIKRYFFINDGGTEMYVVANDRAHAEQILKDRGVLFRCDDDPDGNEPPPIWNEISAEKALTVHVHDDDDCLERTKDPDILPNLTHYDVGQFFSSEY